MGQKITKSAFDKAEAAMNDLLAIATQKGGFEHLTSKEAKDLAKVTKVVETFEAEHYKVPMPDTLQGLIALKMYEQQLKQKDLADLLKTTPTQLSEIMHSKRKPTVSFLKAMHQFLGIDGNLLLKLA